MTHIKNALKHQVVAAALREEIASGRWNNGDRLPAEYDLAPQFEVSYMTIRQAVALLVSEGMLVRVQGKGTFVVTPEEEPAKTAELPLALLFPTDWLGDDPHYLPEILQGFERHIVEHGHAPVLVNYGLARSGLLDPSYAVACLLITEAHVELIGDLRDAGYKVLAINHYMGRRTIPSVRIDDASGMEQAVDHLVELGHRRIGFVCGDPSHLDSMDRLRGFRNAMARHGLRRSLEIGNGYSERVGYAAAGELLARRNKPTAIICSSDLAAIGAINRVREQGLRVPEDLSIVGYGDFSVAAYVQPGLTTIRQSRRELGTAAAETLIRLASGKNSPDMVLGASLILRGTTAPAPEPARERSGMRALNPA